MFESGRTWKLKYTRQALRELLRNTRFLSANHTGCVASTEKESTEEKRDFRLKLQYLK